MAYHPWRELRQMTHIHVSWADLPMGTHGRTDGSSRIEIARDLLQVERRCALAHEMQHIFMGHRGHQSAAIERAVRGIVARRLVSFSELLDACSWAGNDIHQLADELWVTPSVIKDRFRAMSKGERDELSGLH